MLGGRSRGGRRECEGARDRGSRGPRAQSPGCGSASVGSRRIFCLTFLLPLSNALFACCNQHHCTTRLVRINFRHYTLWVEQRRSAPESTAKPQDPLVYLQQLLRTVVDLHADESPRAEAGLDSPATPLLPAPDPRTRCEDLPPIILEYLVKVGAGQIQVMYVCMYVCMCVGGSACW